MNTAKAPRKSVSRNAASIPALVLLGALSGTALAATDIQEPCPEAAESANALHAFIAGDEHTAPLVRTVEATKPVAPAKVTETSTDEAVDSPEAEKTPATDSATPAYTTQLPGVSANDMPGFRRHMYRTDI